MTNLANLNLLIALGKKEAQKYFYLVISAVKILPEIIIL